VPTELVVQTLNIENYNTHEAKVDFSVELGEFDASSAGSFTVVLLGQLVKNKISRLRIKKLCEVGMFFQVISLGRFHALTQAANRLPC
jgi:hypothetical protein